MIRLGAIFFLVTFFAYLVQSLLFFGDNADELMAVPLALILGGIAGFFLNKDRTDPDADDQTGLFFWAYSMRLWCGQLFYGWGFSGIVGDEDASGYSIAWRYVENWYNNGFDGFVSDLVMVFFERQNIGQGLLWAIPNAIAAGPSRMIVSVVNCFAGALLVIVLFRLCRNFFDSKTARIAAILLTFWPSMILFSAWTTKEILVILFEWTTLYLIVRTQGGIKLKDGLIAIPFMLGVLIMRFYASYMIIAAFIFRILTAGGKNQVRNFVFGSMIIGSMGIFLLASGVINRDFERIERHQNMMSDWRENVAEHTGSGIDVYTQFESTPIAVPIATVYFFLSPFPWEVFSGSARNGFGAIENIAIILILIIGFPAIKIFFRDKFFDLLPIFVFCGLYAGLHIWVLSNAGLAWRHKQTVMPLFFMLAAVAYTQRDAAWKLLTGGKVVKDQELTITGFR